MSKKSASVLRVIGLEVRRSLHRLRRRFPRVFGPRLDCACAVGSTILAQVLRRIGQAARVVKGVFDDRRPGHRRGIWTLLGSRSHHVWVVLDGLYLDVTATQFGKYPAVYFALPDDKSYQVESVGEEARVALLEWSKAEGPARYQAPVKHEVFIAREVERIVSLTLASG